MSCVLFHFIQEEQGHKRLRLSTRHNLVTTLARVPQILEFRTFTCIEFASFSPWLYTGPGNGWEVAFCLRISSVMMEDWKAETKN